MRNLYFSHIHEYMELEKREAIFGCLHEMALKGFGSKTSREEFIGKHMPAVHPKSPKQHSDLHLAPPGARSGQTRQEAVNAAFKVWSYRLQHNLFITKSLALDQIELAEIMENTTVTFLMIATLDCPYKVECKYVGSRSL